jgi:hypothetical protein
MCTGTRGVELQGALGAGARLFVVGSRMLRGQRPGAENKIMGL